MASGQISKNRFLGTLTTGYVTVYTVPAGKTALFVGLNLVNYDTVSRKAYGRLADNSSPTVYAFWFDQSSVTAMQPGEALSYSLAVLKAADSIQLKAEAGSVVDYILSIVEQED